ncbi:MAG: hypothetical protein AB7L09_02365 [Nitrospira sp.]
MSDLGTLFHLETEAYSGATGGGYEYQRKLDNFLIEIEFLMRHRDDVDRRGRVWVDGGDLRRRVWVYDTTTATTMVLSIDVDTKFRIAFADFWEESLLPGLHQALEKRLLLEKLASVEQTEAGEAQ